MIDTKVVSNLALVSKPFKKAVYDAVHDFLCTQDRATSNQMLRRLLDSDKVSLVILRYLVPISTTDHELGKIFIGKVSGTAWGDPNSQYALTTAKKIKTIAVEAKLSLFICFTRGRGSEKEMWKSAAIGNLVCDADLMQWMFDQKYSPLPNSLPSSKEALQSLKNSDRQRDIWTVLITHPAVSMDHLRLLKALTNDPEALQKLSASTIETLVQRALTSKENTNALNRMIATESSVILQVLFARIDLFREKALTDMEWHIVELCKKTANEHITAAVMNHLEKRFQEQPAPDFILACLLMGQYDKAIEWGKTLFSSTFLSLYPQKIHQAFDLEMCCSLLLHAFSHQLNRRWIWAKIATTHNQILVSHTLRVISAFITVFETAIKGVLNITLAPLSNRYSFKKGLFLVGKGIPLSIARLFLALTFYEHQMVRDAIRNTNALVEGINLLSEVLSNDLSLNNSA